MLIDHFIPRSLANWIAEFMHRFRTLVSIAGSHNTSHEAILQPTEKAGFDLPNLKPHTNSLAEAPISSDLDAGFIRMVEEGLRKLPDFIRLGQLPLAEYMGVEAESKVIRGKEIHQLLRAGIESLRPPGRRPATAPSRDWFHYIILHDAYVLGLRNRDVMARLYISEGTFNRTRRNAVRGVAIWLIELTHHERNIN